jgi:TolB protein
VRLIPVALVLGLFGVALLALGPGRTEVRAPALEAHLAYVDEDDNLVTARADGSQRQRIVALEASKLAAPPAQGSVRLYRWPTWAPDGTRLAFMTVDVDTSGQNALGAVHVADLGRGVARQVWASRRGGPIYSSWHPHGRLVTLLALGDDTLHLLVADPLSSRPWYPLASGQSVYVAWSPDGRAAAIHTGGDQRTNPAARLLLATWDGPRGTPHTEQLALEPNGFRAPAWSADGRWLALGVHLSAGPAVVLRGRDGAVRPVAATRAEPAFVWSPTAPLLALADAAVDLPNVYAGITIHDVRRGTHWPLTSDLVVAFFWSPDGQQLAYIALDRPSRALTWRVVGADGRDERTLARLLPTHEQFQTFAFFDQYAQSHALWSPDGQALVAAGWNADEGLPLPGVSSSIYVIPVDGKTPMRRIGSGAQAFWSPLAVPAWQP